MIDQVILSAGELGGVVVDATDWIIGEERIFKDIYKYRREGEQALFVGMTVIENEDGKVDETGGGVVEEGV